MDKKVTLRSLEKDDLSWVRELRNKNREYFFDNNLVTKEQQEKWFKALDYPFYIIEYNGNPAGTIGIKKNNTYIEIHNVLIDEIYRGKGILKEVMRLLEEKYP